jgi:8-oxo-dGTP pyrophosphatase MutT (NUDIX family)
MVHSVAMAARTKNAALSTMMISPAPRLHQKTTKKIPISLLGKMRECEQVAAVCYRIRRGAVEFLLVQTRGTRRWIFPKGSAERGLTHAQAAAIEAFEEAGVHGRIEEDAFARYKNRKQNSRRSARYTAKFQIVSAHLCEVRRLGNPKEPNRNRTWFSVQEAIRCLREGRKTEDGNEFARVVELAVARIDHLNIDERSISEMRLRPMIQDELHKVQFEALPQARSPFATSRRLALPAGRVRASKIVSCQVLPFAAPLHSARNQRLLLSPTNFKALGTGARKG